MPFLISIIGIILLQFIKIYLFNFSVEICLINLLHGRSELLSLVAGGFRHPGTYSRIQGNETSEKSGDERRGSV